MESTSGWAKSVATVVVANGSVATSKGAVSFGVPKTLTVVVKVT